MKFTVESAPKYGKHYSDDGFWKKLRKLAAQAGTKLLYPALQLYYLMQSKEVPLGAKTLIIGALGYLILPADLIPDFIPALGITDDMTAIMLALRNVMHYMTPEIKSKAKEQADKIVRQSDIQ